MRSALLDNELELLVNRLGVKSLAARGNALGLARAERLRYHRSVSGGRLEQQQCRRRDAGQAPRAAIVRPRASEPASGEGVELP